MTSELGIFGFDSLLLLFYFSYMDILVDNAHLSMLDDFFFKVYLTNYNINSNERKLGIQLNVIFNFFDVR